MRKVLGLSLACLAIPWGGAAQELDAQGVGEYQIAQTGGTLVITKGGRSVRKIELRTLPIRRNDCEYGVGCRAGDSCFGICARNPQVFAIDEVRRRAYFTVDTGTAQNRPKVLYEVSLTSGKVRRLTNDDSGGLIAGAVSPGGRYLAYIAVFKRGLSCPPIWGGFVVDLRELRSAPLPEGPPTYVPQGRALQTADVRWLNSNLLAAHSSLREEVCDGPRDDWGPGEKVEQTVDVRTLPYR